MLPIASSTLTEETASSRIELPYDEDRADAKGTLKSISNLLNETDDYDDADTHISKGVSMSVDDTKMSEKNSSKHISHSIESGSSGASSPDVHKSAYSKLHSGASNLVDDLKTDGKDSLKFISNFLTAPKVAQSHNASTNTAAHFSKDASMPVDDTKMGEKGSSKHISHPIEGDNSGASSQDVHKSASSKLLSGASKLVNDFKANEKSTSIHSLHSFVASNDGPTNNAHKNAANHALKDTSMPNAERKNDETSSSKHTSRSFKDNNRASSHNVHISNANHSPKDASRHLVETKANVKVPSKSFSHSIMDSTSLQDYHSNSLKPGNDVKVERMVSSNFVAQPSKVTNSKRSNILKQFGSTVKNTISRVTAPVVLFIVNKGLTPEKK